MKVVNFVAVASPTHSPTNAARHEVGRRTMFLIARTGLSCLDSATDSTDRVAACVMAKDRYKNSQLVSSDRRVR